MKSGKDSAGKTSDYGYLLLSIHHQLVNFEPCRIGLFFFQVA